MDGQRPNSRNRGFLHRQRFRKFSFPYSVLIFTGSDFNATVYRVEKDSRAAPGLSAASDSIDKGG